MISIVFMGRNRTVRTDERYFTIIKDYFGDFAQFCKRKNVLTLQESVNACGELYPLRMIEPIMTSLYEELSSLDWETQANQIKKLGGVCSSYLGNAYIYLNEKNKTFDVLKKTALYSDTTLVNDPLLSELCTWKQRETGADRSFQILAQYALQLLSIEELFSNDINPPICYLAPSSVLILKQQNALETTQNFIEESVITFYASALFKRDFVSSNELFEFLSKFGNFRDFLAAIQKSEISLINPDGMLVDEAKCQSIKQYYEDKYCLELSMQDALFAIIRGRFGMGAYDLMVNGRFTPNFVTDFKGVWNNLLLLLKDKRLEVAAMRKGAVTKDMVMLNALQGEQFRWLGDVPLNKIRELRQRGELQEMRDLLGQNINDIQNANDADFGEVATQVEYSLREGFKRHNEEVSTLDKKYRSSYNIDLPSLIVSGALGVASTVYPPLVYVAGITGGTTILDIVRKYREKKQELEELKKKPVAMLFDAYEKTTDQV